MKTMRISFTQLPIQLATAAAVGALLTGAAAASAGSLLMTDRVNPAIAADVPLRSDIADLGRAPATTPVSIAVTLRYRHESELEWLTLAQSLKGSAYYGRYLNNAQWNAYFAPSSDAYAR